MSLEVIVTGLILFNPALSSGVNGPIAAWAREVEVGGFGGGGGGVTAGFQPADEAAAPGR